MRVLLIIIAGILALALFQRTQIQTAKAEQLRLKAASAQVATDNGAVPPTDVKALQQEIAALREADRDIHKLRGQITMARKKAKDVARLKADNAQLVSKLAKVKGEAKGGKVPNPFSKRGQATPEATVETMFWAMREGDLQTFGQVHPIYGVHMKAMQEEERKIAGVMMRGMMSDLLDVKILNTREMSKDEARVEIALQPKNGATEFPLPGLISENNTSSFVTRRTNGVWSIVTEQ